MAKSGYRQDKEQRADAGPKNNRLPEEYQRARTFKIRMVSRSSVAALAPTVLQLLSPAVLWEITLRLQSGALLRTSSFVVPQFQPRSNPPGELRTLAFSRRPSAAGEDVSSTASNARFRNSIYSAAPSTVRCENPREDSSMLLPCRYPQLNLSL
jgi:hypothetical protein